MPMVTLQIALQTALQVFPDWVFDARLLLATFLVLAHPVFYRFTPAWLRDSRVKWHWIVPGVWVVIMTAMLMGPAWGTGRWVAPRVLGTLYMVFLLGWFTTLFVVIRHVVGGERPSLPDGRVWTAVLILFAGSLIVTGNTRRTINDLRGPLQNWEAARERRAALIADARQAARDLVIRSNVPLPSSVGFLELTEQPRFYGNACAAIYHGVPSIVEFRPGS
jgi:hypothetical protein